MAILIQGKILFFSVAVGEGAHEVDGPKLPAAGDEDAVLAEHFQIEENVVSHHYPGMAEKMGNGFLPLPYGGLVRHHGRRDVVHRHGTGPAYRVVWFEIFIHEHLALAVKDRHLQKLCVSQKAGGFRIQYKNVAFIHPGHFLSKKRSLPCALTTLLPRLFPGGKQLHWEGLYFSWNGGVSCSAGSVFSSSCRSCWAVSFPCLHLP